MPVTGNIFDVLFWKPEVKGRLNVPETKPPVPGIESPCLRFPAWCHDHYKFIQKWNNLHQSPVHQSSSFWRKSSNLKLVTTCPFLKGLKNGTTLMHFVSLLLGQTLRPVFSQNSVMPIELFFLHNLWLIWGLNSNFFGLTMSWSWAFIGSAPSRTAACKITFFFKEAIKLRSSNQYSTPSMKLK